MNTTADTRALFEAGAFEEITDYEAEHILIEDEHGEERSQPESVSATYRICNAQTGRDMELALYREGFVRFRESAGAKLEHNYFVDLDYLDPRFRSRLMLARGWLALAIVSGLALVGSLNILPAVGLVDYRFHAAAIAGLLLLVGLHRFFRKTSRVTAFMTKTGRAPVIRLVANIGCFGEARKAARALKAAVKAREKKGGLSDQAQLKKEMKVHYQLAKDGAISQETCSQSTARILAKFE